MKKKILAACVIAAASITFTSCDWFKTKSKNANPTIVGKWQVDSLYPIGKDSNNLVYLGYAIAKKDNQPITIQFNADSTYSESDSSHATKHKYYLAKDSIYVQNDSSFIAYKLSFKNDSSLQLLSKDSALYILSKKKTTLTIAALWNKRLSFSYLKNNFYETSILLGGSNCHQQPTYCLPKYSN